MSDCLGTGCLSGEPRGHRWSVDTYCERKHGQTTLSSPTSTCLLRMSRIPVPRSQSGTFHFPPAAADSHHHHHGSPLRQEPMSAVSSPLPETRKKQSKRDEVSTVHLSQLRPTSVGTRLCQYRRRLCHLAAFLIHPITSLLFRSVVLVDSR